MIKKSDNIFIQVYRYWTILQILGLCVEHLSLNTNNSFETITSYLSYTQKISIESLKQVKSIYNKINIFSEHTFINVQS